jgi:hypothetical protein
MPSESRSNNIENFFLQGKDRLFLVWPLTIEHYIDENSPFWDISADDLKKGIKQTFRKTSFRKLCLGIYFYFIFRAIRVGCYFGRNCRKVRIILIAQLRKGLKAAELFV